MFSLFNIYFILHLIGMIYYNTAELTFLLTEPNDSIYVIPSMNKNNIVDKVASIKENKDKLSIPIKFDLIYLTTNELYDKTNYEFCFILSKTLDNQYLEFQEHCVPITFNNFYINDNGNGNYILKTYLKNNLKSILKNSIIIKEFQIIDHYEALPQLNYIHDNNNIDIVANIINNVTDVLVEYKFIEVIPKLFNLLDLKLCLYIKDSTTKQLIMPKSCTKLQSSVILQNLAIGKYEIYSFLENSNDNNNDKINNNEKILLVNVYKIEEYLPSINIPLIDDLQSFEFVTDPSTHLASIKVAYQLNGLLSAINQLQICIKLTELSKEYNTNEIVIISNHCISSKHDEFSLSGISIGRYKVYIVYAQIPIIPIPMQPAITYPSTGTSVSLIIQDQIEFIPTYDWQPLHVWHTIPASIETRLPIGNGMRKEARIPQPWKLQLSMPIPCKYFLRMDLYKHTTMKDIMQAASMQCNHPIECFVIYGDMIELDSSLTVEETNFFSKNKKLEFNYMNCNI